MAMLLELIFAVSAAVVAGVCYASHRKSLHDKERGRNAGGEEFP